MKNEAVIVVDYQNDFANPETGSLYVKWWEKIAPAINEVVRWVKNKWWVVVASRELHPMGHISFASSFWWKESIIEAFKRNESPSEKNFITKKEISTWNEKVNWLSKSASFTVWQLKAYLESNWDQALWPEHCVDWSFWSKFAKWFDPKVIDIEIKKWFKSDSHPYSAFWWKTLDWLKSTFEVLKDLWVKVVKVVWLATDYCDLATVLDARKYGIETEFVLSASAWVDPTWTIEALKQMREAWAKIIEFK